MWLVTTLPVPLYDCNSVADPSGFPMPLLLGLLRLILFIDGGWRCAVRATHLIYTFYWYCCTQYIVVFVVVVKVTYNA